MFTERAITERLQARAGLHRALPVVLGIGDDCAIYRPRGSVDDLLFTSDMFIEDVHFRRETHSAREAGRKALVRSLSDIAAMGGRPQFCLVSLCVPEWANRRWVDAFFDGLLTLNVVLAGGDLSHGEKLACDVTVCGSVPRGKALLRSGARPGDAVYVSGELGGSALGLLEGRVKAWKRHVRPEARLGLGVFLRDRLHATAAMDLSDGLSRDLERLCLASRAAAAIGEPPRFPGATLEQALHGGEDYELLFTVASDTRVPAAFDGLPLTRIGTILKGRAGLVTFHDKPLAALGYDHFLNP